jgi:hypothetical protein
MAAIAKTSSQGCMVARTIEQVVHVTGVKVYQKANGQ